MPDGGTNCLNEFCHKERVILNFYSVSVFFILKKINELYKQPYQINEVE